MEERSQSAGDTEGIDQAKSSSVQTSDNAEPRKKKRRGNKLVILLGVIILGLLVAGATGFVFFEQEKKSPENVFMKAIASFANQNSFVVNGTMDQGDPNEPDFVYKIVKTDQAVSLLVDSSSFLQGPDVELLQANDKTYIKFDNWLDTKELAEQYTNDGEKGLQENLSEFAETSGIANMQGEWIEVDPFVFDGVESTSSPGAEQPTSLEEAGVTIEEIGDTEEIDGSKLQNYTIRLQQNTIFTLLNQIGLTNLPVTLIQDYLDENEFPESLVFDVQVDTGSEEVYKISYNGRPFRDATFSLELLTQQENLEVPDQAKLASQVLDYGILRTFLFNENLQNGETERDRERIADIKAIKMAMELYKTKNGSYPSRSFPVVGIFGYDTEFFEEFDSADRSLFEDPNGRRLGWNGSQYAYIGETSNGDQACGDIYFDYETMTDIKAPDCTKFWTATTLDDGTEYKLVSY